MAAADPAAPRILIVRRDNIGDLVCTTPLIEALRARFPRGRIAALVNTYNAEVLARSPALDALYAYEKLKHRARPLAAFVLHRFRIRSQLRRERFDCVLLPSATPQARRIARALRAAEIVAPDGRAADARHEVERTFELGRALGLEGKPGAMRVYPSPEKRRELRARLGTEPLTAVHISARRPAQRWPWQRYAQLVRELCGQGRVLLLWAPGSAGDPRHPGDDETSAKIVREVNRADLVALPTPDLKTLIAALSLAGRAICPDGGAMHLAAALGMPVVALFGDAPAERWRPWGVPYRVVQPESRDLADLGLEPVLQALAELGASP
jgi:ADP-heptose:LPS heptosyltransferase